MPATSPTTFPLPGIVAHADWSVNPAKRWAVVGALSENGRYHLHAPSLVGEPLAWLRRLGQQAAGQALLVGLDFPIGLPLAYAQRVGVADFLTLLPQLGQGEWADFYRVAERREEIGGKRPFYPQRSGGTKQQHLLDALQVQEINDLRRRCDLPQPYRRAAAPLFWSLGAQQVGKAAISGWQELLAPARQDKELDAAIWPFSGRLADLLAAGRLVLAEAYPAEFYHHLALAFPRQVGGKRRQAGRQHNAPRLLAWVANLEVTLDEGLRAAIIAGFGPAPDGEDAFDACVGALGMVHGLVGERPLPEPTDAQICQIEGWILGQAING